PAPPAGDELERRGVEIGIVRGTRAVDVQVVRVGGPVGVDVDGQAAAAGQVPPVRDGGEDPEDDEAVADQLEGGDRLVEPEGVAEAGGKGFGTTRGASAGAPVGGHAGAPAGWNPLVASRSSAGPPRRPTTIGARRQTANAIG